MRCPPPPPPAIDAAPFPQPQRPRASTGPSSGSGLVGAAAGPPVLQPALSSPTSRKYLKHLLHQRGEPAAATAAPSGTAAALNIREVADRLSLGRQIAWVRCLFCCCFVCGGGGLGGLEGGRVACRAA
jgi:hypothetical protein